jgi:hypothetical protein
LDRIAKIFKGYLGDRSSYAGFSYGELSWQCNSSAPVGINPDGCTKSGQAIGGVMPDDMRRGGSFKWPPATTGYPWEGLQGMVVQAELLHRAGYPAWEWSDKAVCRAVRFLYTIGWQPSGDDPWQIPLVNSRCGTKYATSGLGSPGKIAGWTFWSHGSGVSAVIERQRAVAPAEVYIDVAEMRVVVGETETELAEEVQYLVDLEGWQAVGPVEQTTDADGDMVYSQVLVR